MQLRYQRLCCTRRRACHRARADAGRSAIAVWADAVDAVDAVLEKLLSVRGERPGKQVALEDNEIRMVCIRAREVLMAQPILLELEEPEGYTADGKVRGSGSGTGSNNGDGSGGTGP